MIHQPSYILRLFCWRNKIEKIKLWQCFIGIAPDSSSLPETGAILTTLSQWVSSNNSRISQNTIKFKENTVTTKYMVINVLEQIQRRWTCRRLLSLGWFSSLKFTFPPQILQKNYFTISTAVVDCLRCLTVKRCLRQGRDLKASRHLNKKKKIFFFYFKWFRRIHIMISISTVTGKL